ncbi:hypothetical protein MNBD_GAMMA02-918 [hydrothermal vent metagenome]|uniref:Glycosyltransferase n=1 Tax=hydrothermal vent metagenome TaxID=652676 RepID=A0A3B0W671_9ZZZZ
MENYLRDLAQAQALQGHEVTAWVHNHDWQKLISKTTTSLDGDVKLVRQKSLKPLLFTPVMLDFGNQLKQILNQQTPDVIHLHWPNPSLFKLLLHKSARNIPWVISWHSDMVTTHSSKLMKLIYWFIKPLESILIKRASSLLVSTQSYANHSKQLSKHVKKTTVIPLGMATTEIADLDINPSSAIFQQVEKNWPAKHFRLFHLGRLTFYKNQRFLIDAMQSLPDAHLLIAGEGQLQQKLEGQIKQLSLTDRVTLLGGIDWPQVHALFASCEVFCMASHDRAESFGVVLLEAMYHDKIILVPDTAGSGMQWLAVNYNKGFVYQANDRDDFVAKVQFIRQNFTDIITKPKQFNYQIQHIAEYIQQHYMTILTGDEQ